MGRMKMEVPNRITVDIADLAKLSDEMTNDNQLGAFIRKSIADLKAGCTSENVDPRVSKVFENALDKMKCIQDINKRYCNSKAIEKAKKEKKPFGAYGHVMLTIDEGKHLRQLYGEKLEDAINILDSYIENNGKAAKRYKNHASVLRKNNWVWQRMMENEILQKRLDNAKNGRKSFAAMERERNVRIIRGEDPDGRTDTVKDHELSLTELHELYG